MSGAQVVGVRPTEWSLKMQALTASVAPSTLAGAGGGPRASRSRCRSGTASLARLTGPTGATGTCRLTRSTGSDGLFASGRMSLRTRRGTNGCFRRFGFHEDPLTRGDLLDEWMGRRDRGDGRGDPGFAGEVANFGRL